MRVPNLTSREILQKKRFPSAFSAKRILHGKEGVCAESRVRKGSPAQVHPTPLDRRLAFQLHNRVRRERFGSLERMDKVLIVVDDRFGVASMSVDAFVAKEGVTRKTPV
jgi:hypothetical protein